MINYESMIVFNPDLSEEDVKSENEKILSMIQSFNGEILKTDDWGKRTLTYEIMKKKEGYYLINYFKMEAKNLAELENQYKLNESILRYNLLRANEE
ncbi:MAG: 30S ribosomal protein S6 [Candidatus Cloacimonetes bacterium]|nr:30S ribosomal protein S6 [Candidatus Cloacimonadota bacterium]